MDWWRNGFVTNIGGDADATFNLTRSGDWGKNPYWSAGPSLVRGVVGMILLS